MWTGLSIIFLMLVLALVMSFPATQTFVAHKAVSWVNDKYGTDIELARFQYVFPDEFELEEVLIKGERGDTLTYASKINLFFGGFNSLTNTAHSRGVEVHDVKFYWTKEEGDDEYGFQKFVSRFSSGDTTESENPFGLEISDIALHNGRFWYEDKTCDDCFRMLLNNINIDASNFDLEGAYLSIDIDEMSLQDKYSLDIKSLSGFYSMQADHMDIDGLEFETAESTFDGDVLFEYNSMEDFQDFVNKVNIKARIRESRLQSTEIQKFGEEFPNFEIFSLTGEAEGTVNNLHAKDIDLTVGERTHLAGDLSLKNTTYTDSIFIHAHDLDVETTPEDIQFVYGLFSDSALPLDVNPLGDVALKGDFEGYLDNFKADVQLGTAIGDVIADLSLKNATDPATAEYDGDLSLKTFDLGGLLQDSTLGRVSTELSLKGKGTLPEFMNTQLKGKVDLLEIGGYAYQKIKIDGQIKKGRFNGKLGVRDPNLNFDFNGTASLDNDTSTFKFNANVQHADLFALHLAPDSVSVFTAEMDIDLVALNYEKWAGDVRLFNTTYENANNFYFFQDIKVHAEGLDTNRYLEVRSNIVDANLSGDYSFKGIQQAFASQISKFVKSTDPVSPPEDEDFIFDITIKNTLLITELLIPELTVEPQSKLKGTYSHKEGNLDVVLNSPGFIYNKNQVRNVFLEYEGGVEKSSLEFDVGGILFKNGVAIDSLALDNFYYNDTLLYSLSGILRDSIDSYLQFNGYALQLDSTSFEFGINESGFNIGFQEFKILNDNRILVDTGGIHVEDLVIANEGRKIYINGNISDNPNEVLRLNLRGFGMNITNYFIGSTAARFKGKLYGDVILTELLGEPKFAANVNIDSLEMNSTLLGDFNVTSDWSVEDDTIRLESSLVLGDLRSFHAKGYYQPDSLGTMSFDANFNRFRVAAFNPFLTGIAENARGYITGDIKVRGNTGTPLVTGELELPNTAFTVSLLKADYNVEGIPKVRIEKDKIVFPDLSLRDTKYGTKAVVTGGISHKNFQNFVLDFDIKADELLVLNTDATTDDPYYGTAFVSGDIGIKGPTDEIRIVADVRTERNTEFYLPIDGATEVSKSSFVTFIEDPSKVDTTAELIQRSVNLNKGVSLDFNMNVTNNAKVTIIVDRDEGNELEATGYGNIRMKMNPYQDIEMYGTYNVSDGLYNFIIPGLKRKFQVLEGGTVGWNGDPFGAIINLSARYTTKADPGVLVNIDQGGRTTVILDLFLTGELFNPDIDFDIRVPRADGTVQSVLNNQLQDKDKMYRQVFSLLALNSFQPAEGLDVGGGSGKDLAFSAISTQAAGYINQLTGDYEVSLDYQAPSDQAALSQREEVEVGVSKSFFDDRVTVNGSVGVAVGENATQNNQRQVAGDFEIEYNISEDGRFRAKVFNRSVDDPYKLGQQNYQQGAGVFYRIDFENWSDLFKAKSPNETLPEEEDFIDENEKGL